MSEYEDRKRRVREDQARLLAGETGITEEQARGLIAAIGLDRASLVREARIVRAQQKKLEDKLNTTRNSS